MNTIKVAPIVLTVALGFQFAPAVASADAGTAQRPFSFRAVETMPSYDREAAVQNFLTQELPAGVPASEAVTRLQHAAAHCGRPEAATAPIRCEFTDFDSTTDGYFGEATWTVTLSQNDQGLLTGTTFNRTRTGFGGN